MDLTRKLVREKQKREMLETRLLEAENVIKTAREQMSSGLPGIALRTLQGYYIPPKFKERRP